MLNSHNAVLGEIKSTLNGWKEQAHQISKECGHYAIKYKKLNNAIGILLVIFSTISGSTAFNALMTTECQADDVRCLEWTAVRRGIVAVLSISAALLAGLQNFFRFGELAEKYRSIGIGYEKIIIDIEAIPSKYEKAEIKIYEEEKIKIKSRMESLADMMPDVLELGPIHKKRNRRNITSLKKSQKTL